MALGSAQPEDRVANDIGSPLRSPCIYPGLSWPGLPWATSCLEGRPFKVSMVVFCTMHHHQVAQLTQLQDHGALLLSRHGDVLSRKCDALHSNTDAILGMKKAPQLTSLVSYSIKCQALADRGGSSALLAARSEARQKVRGARHVLRHMQGGDRCLKLCSKCPGGLPPATRLITLQPRT